MSQKSRTAEATLRLSPAPRGLSHEDDTDVLHLSREVTLPAVSATSRVIALMELAAAKLVQQNLRGAEVSVGVAMNVTHAAPALVAGDIRGASVRAVASYRYVAGRLHHVEIDAFDESGLIASAEHTRTIVMRTRVQTPARRRAGMRAMSLAV